MTKAFVLNHLKVHTKVPSSKNGILTHKAEVYTGLMEINHNDQLQILEVEGENRNLIINIK
jgi:hypothetical protein